VATRPRRTWPQRLVLGFNVVVVVGCLVMAGVVWWANQQIGRLHRLTIVHAPGSALDLTSPAGSPASNATTPSRPLGATNFLFTGSDSRSCIDPSSPYAGAFLGEGSTIGARSDTIMVFHVDPASAQAAILSFPRDLWVPIAGTTRKDRINSAFSPDDPNQLVQTIETNFGIRIDHYVGVDFCAFKTMVDTVGGVRIPFAYPTRDTHTGLDIAQPGCVKMAGDEALAYVRSRYYEYQTPDGVWHPDSTSDYGRIARQQDFVRRVLHRALDRGATNPAVAKQLLDIAVSNDVHVDADLTLSDLIELGHKLRNLDTSSIQRYRFEGRGTVIGGADVIIPTLDTPTNRAVLALFRGETSTATTPALADTQAGTGTTTPTDAAPPDNLAGIYPPADPACH
jgi:LCP family protein required for cell wall assembly